MRGKLGRFLCGSSQVAADAVDMEVDDGGLAFLGEEEAVVGYRVHEEVFH